MSNPSPCEVDERLRDLHVELAKLEQKQASDAASIMRGAGAGREYRGKTPTWNMSFEDAVKATEQQADEHEGSYIGHQARERLASYADSSAAVEYKKTEIEKQEQLYENWSRFFVVTSSNGHIHSSMHCPTCYWSTTYGWLPELSGKTEAEAVETCGPALCSVCFPSAPVEHVGDKLTEQEAEELTQGKTIGEIRAAKNAAKQAKADAKAEKARKAAERAKELLAKVETFYAEHGGEYEVMKLDIRELYALTDDLQMTVQDVILDDHRECHGGHRYSKNPRAMKLAQDIRENLR